MRRTLALGLVTGALLAACETVPADSASVSAPRGPLFSDYQGTPEIMRRSGAPSDEARGTVFDDQNRNGTQDEDEPGVRGVKVSNGREVVLTGADGSYSLPARDDMAVFVIQPSGYQVPHNQNWVPQFAYQHKPSGSPKPLRYGGLPATGPLPSEINFPLIRTGTSDNYRCAILGDTQTYANQEIGYFRDSTVDDILDRPEAEHPACIVAVGDVMGDDLGLIPRMAEVIGTLRAPQWWIHGNHDLDFDADYDEDSADSWRRLWGPNYYAFEIGDVLFIALDNVVYPCTQEDVAYEAWPVKWFDEAQMARRFCTDDKNKRYNGRITTDQMAFVENLLALTDENKLVVYAHHIPFVTFFDQTAGAHQTDNVRELYALTEGREALSLSGHTHTTENFAPGDSFEGWEKMVGVESLPFRHIIAGAASGAWYNGDFDHHGVPMALQRMGAPRGWLSLDFDGATYKERYIGSNVGRERSMWVSVNTPIFRSWYTQIMAWRDTPRNRRDPVPPLSINDLPDVKILTPRDLSRGTFLTANIWDGSTETRAEVIIGERTITMERTQEAQGEAARIGAEWADPFAAQRQLSVARYALESRSGIERNQGWEAYKGNRFGPSTPQPQGSVADRNSHLWRARLPDDLPQGVHVARVRATDRHGRVTEDTTVLEVRDIQPPARFRNDVFEAVENGPPVR
ncbi:metallophosphoesterase [Parvularcula sp. ZS-1/3]|uniref:Metallophosphoesterase n=1 Tax=Parvularcula mediterranea TaxID=2732508 RepID=A0A7Y3RME8_9PROT|nr:calcineurin-like phosphoesterase family protein [Parvularcula mediterranea]NNU15942.1 metallophosphoesterase [Parvularcula mediterranea]